MSNNLNNVSCPLCNSLKGKRIILTIPFPEREWKEINLIKCEDCEIIFSYPKLSENDLKAYYPDCYWRNIKSPLARLENFLIKKLFYTETSEIKKIIFKIKKENLNKNDNLKILDIGCGAGDFLNALSKLNLKLYGMDVSEKALDIANQFPHINTKQADITADQLPYDQEFFDIITLFHTLEHLPYPDKALENIKKLLRKEGYLIIQVPNINSLLFKITKKKWAGLHLPQHLFHFNEKSLKNILENHNFKIIKIKNFSLRNNPAQVVSSFFHFLNPIYLRERISNRFILLFFYALHFLFFLLLFPFSIIEALLKQGNTITIIAQPKTGRI